MKNYSDYLIVSDLDGTLINSQHIISQENLSAIDYFVAQGGSFAIATGRSIQNVRPFIKDLKLNGPCILYNGAALYDFRHEKLLQSEILEKDLLKDYVIHCTKSFEQMVVEIFTPESMYITTPEKNIDPYVQHEKQPFKRASLNEVLEHDWLKIMLYDQHNTLMEAQKSFLNFDMADKFENVFSHEFYFEVLKKGVSKGSALKSLRRLEHFNDKKIVAVGDYDNDAEMVSYADVGVAVENARECVKKAADRITVSNDEDAIHDIIYNIIPSI